MFLDKEFSNILANREIYLICVGISNSLESILEVSTLTFDQVQLIKIYLEDKFRNVFDFPKFRDQYYKNAHNNLSQVNFIGLGIDLSIKKGKRKNIDDIYVKPFFRIKAESLAELKEQEIEALIPDLDSISYKSIPYLGKHLIILGNPGSGKSFLIKSIMCAIIKENETSIRDYISLLPFRLELRKYLSYKKEKGGNILGYLSYVLETEYGIYGILDTTLDRTISNVDTLMFFDGLDEIFNINDRIDVKNDIENFVVNYSKLRSITTSRIIGYEEAILNPKTFTQIEIKSFNDAQIREYVNKWYEVEEEDDAIRLSEIDDFIEKKNNVDSELIRNPLLLSLIVILYRNNLKLPESKLEIYESCTSTLVDKWDLSKQMSIELDEEILKRKEAILADLAYWQYIELTDNKGSITYEKARNNVARTLLSKLKLADEYSVDSIAENFMDYAKKRSIYFDNNFTHKTFLEYYTAFWIFTNIEKKHKKTERNKLITKYISNTFWHIVLELLFNLIDKDQADNEMVDDLIEVQLERPDNSVYFLLNIITSIQNVSPETIDRIFSATISLLISYPISHSHSHNNHFITEDKHRVIFESLSKLFDKERFIESIERNLQKIESALNDERQKEKLYYLYFELCVENGKTLTQDLLFTSDYAKVAVSKNPALDRYYQVIYQSKVIQDGSANSLANYIKKHGVDECKKETHAMYARFMLLKFITICYRRQFENLTNFEQNYEVLERTGIDYKDIAYDIVNTRHSYYAYKGTNSSEPLIEAIHANERIELQLILWLFLCNNMFRAYGDKDQMDFSNTHSSFTNPHQLSIYQKLKNAGSFQNAVQAVLKEFGFQTLNLFEENLDEQAVDENDAEQAISEGDDSSG